jgi:invasion protein IalB
MGRSSIIAACLVAAVAASSLPAQAQQPAAPAPAPAQQPSTEERAPQPGVPPQANGSAGGVRQTYGAWSMVCDTPPGASSEQCALVQYVLDEDRPEIGIAISVLKTADRKLVQMRVLAPLGIWLQDGAQLFIDNQNIGTAYFTRCFPDGCSLEFPVEQDLMRFLRAGKSGAWAIKESPDAQNRIAVPFELEGFAAGYDALP